MKMSLPRGLTFHSNFCGEVALVQDIPSRLWFVKAGGAIFGPICQTVCLPPSLKPLGYVGTRVDAHVGQQAAASSGPIRQGTGLRPAASGRVPLSLRNK